MALRSRLAGLVPRLTGTRAASPQLVPGGVLEAWRRGRLFFSSSNLPAIESAVVEIGKRYSSGLTGGSKFSELTINEQDAPRKWDSLDTVEFVLDVEHAFGLQIPDDIADAFTTAKEVATYVSENVPEDQLDLPPPK